MKIQEAEMKTKQVILKHWLEKKYVQFGRKDVYHCVRYLKAAD